MLAFFTPSTVRNCLLRSSKARKGQKGRVITKRGSRTRFSALVKSMGRSKWANDLRRYQPSSRGGLRPFGDRLANPEGRWFASTNVPPGSQLIFGQAVADNALRYNVEGGNALAILGFIRLSITLTISWLASSVAVALDGGYVFPSGLFIRRRTKGRHPSD